MKPTNSIARQRLDQRLGGLGLVIGARPPCGWVQKIRLALGMSTAELGVRMSISQSRASRLERSEVEETIRFSTLRRAAEALNCSLVYVLVPNEPFEDMVLRQAYRKAEEELSPSMSVASGPPLTEGEIEDRLETRTLELIDHRGLWRRTSAWGRGPRTRDDNSIDGPRPGLGSGRRSQGRPEADEVEP
jgi:predicted DNA-binding mobile mystery protein A